MGGIRVERQRPDLILHMRSVLEATKGVSRIVESIYCM